MPTYNIDGKIVHVPGKQRSSDPADYDRAIADVLAMADRYITLEHAIDWAAMLRRQRDALLDCPKL